jgi:hypothetical protein
MISLGKNNNSIHMKNNEFIQNPMIRKKINNLKWIWKKIESNDK